MGRKTFIFSLVLLFALFISACSSIAGKSESVADQSKDVPLSTNQENRAGDQGTPAWFDIEMTDVQSDEAFSMTDFSGKVILIETMAMWCPNCIIQANEVRNLHKALDNPDDFVSISLDVDVNEDAASLKDYSEGYGFEWRFAVAPLEVARALGNLYSAQYLNPPLAPMLLIDRKGEVHELPYGIKKVDDLLAFIRPFMEE